MLAEELQCPYVVSVIDTKDEWYYKIHPERYVPALKDWDAVTNKEVIVFESTACLQYLAERFDADGYWNGTNTFEKGAILSWTAYQTAGLGCGPLSPLISPSCSMLTSAARLRSTGCTS